MNKEDEEELIALSDLNREDNIKYISSEAQGIAIALDSDRYAPTLCKLERAYICGRRKSEKQLEEKDKQIAELKEFYEKEYFEIADRTADEKIKELEKYQTEVTVDDYSPYDENTWGMMHEEMFVPKELVRDLLKESYALSEHRKDNLSKAIKLLNEFIRISKASDEDFEHDYSELIGEVEQFIKGVEK